MKHKREAEKGKDHNVSCRDGNKQTNSQCEWLGEYPDDLDRQNDQAKWQRHAGCPEDVSPIVLVAIQIRDDERNESQRQGYCDVPGKVCRSRKESKQVAEEDEEEQCKQVRQIALVFRAYVRLHNLVLNKNDHWLHE